MVPWWLEEWKRICNRASFASRDVLSEFSLKCMDSLGWKMGRARPPGCSSVSITLSCWAAVSVGDKPRWMSEGGNSAEYVLVRDTSLGIISPWGACCTAQDPKISRVFPGPWSQRDVDAFVLPSLQCPSTYNPVTFPSLRIWNSFIHSFSSYPLLIIFSIKS